MRLVDQNSTSSSSPIRTPTRFSKATFRTRILGTVGLLLVFGAVVIILALKYAKEETTNTELGFPHNEPNTTFQDIHNKEQSSPIDAVEALIQRLLDPINPLFPAQFRLSLIQGLPILPQTFVADNILPARKNKKNRQKVRSTHR